VAKTQHYSELVVWQKAHQVVLGVYRSTKDFPSEERFGLTSQMRRAAVSVPGNIVEGYRRRTIADKARFMNTAHASLDELDYYMLLAGDLGFADFAGLRHQADEVGRLLNRYEAGIRGRRSGEG
jgi:four helix bundle protein